MAQNLEDYYNRYLQMIPWEMNIGRMFGDISRSSLAQYGGAARRASRAWTGSGTSGAYAAGQGDIWAQRAGRLAGVHGGLLGQKHESELATKRGVLGTAIGQRRFDLMAEERARVRAEEEKRRKKFGIMKMISSLGAGIMGGPIGGMLMSKLFPSLAGGAGGGGMTMEQLMELLKQGGGGSEMGDWNMGPAYG